MDSTVNLPSANDIKQSSAKKVVVCRGRSCRKYDAERVIANFKQNVPPDTELIFVPCLGQCGNGPMVLVEPEEIWYSQVHPDEVEKVIEQHIVGDMPVKTMLYPKFHPKK